jgi:hypothetical protein
VDAHRKAQSLAAGRLLFGLGMFVAPTRTTSAWLGADATRPGTVIAVRGIGAREVALSLGLLVALRREDGEPSRWIEAAIVSDIGDATASLLGGRLSMRRLVGVVVASLAAVGGVSVRRELG